MRSTNFTKNWDGQAWLRAGVVLGASLAVARAVGLGDAGHLAEHLPELCVFRRVTGLPCPGCGMTRAFLCLFRADWRGAWALNPWSLPLAAGLLVMALLPAESLARLRAHPATRRLSWLAAVAVLAWWLVVRILPVL